MRVNRTTPNFVWANSDISLIPLLIFTERKIPKFGLDFLPQSRVTEMKQGAWNPICESILMFSSDQTSGVFLRGMGALRGLGD